MKRAILIVIALQILAALPGMVWPGYLDSPIGLALMMPYLSVYLLSALGVPGLLVNQGACGWGLCPPTLAGWCVVLTTWLLGVLLLAWPLAQLIGRSGRDAGAHDRTRSS